MGGARISPEIPARTRLPRAHHRPAVVRMPQELLLPFHKGPIDAK